MFALFFIFGGITSLNDVVIPKLKELFTLSYGEVMLVQSAFFFAYFVVSLPAASIVRRLGYMRTAAIGLVLMTAGCLLFVPASSSALFIVFLASSIRIGLRHHHRSGGREPADLAAGTGADRSQPADLCAGVQFPGHHHFSLCGFDPDSRVALRKWMCHSWPALRSPPIGRRRPTSSSELPGTGQRPAGSWPRWCGCGVTDCLETQLEA